MDHIPILAIMLFGMGDLVRLGIGVRSGDRQGNDVLFMDQELVVGHRTNGQRLEASPGLANLPNRQLRTTWISVVEPRGNP